MVTFFLLEGLPALSQAEATMDQARASGRAWRGYGKQATACPWTEPLMAFEEAELARASLMFDSFGLVVVAVTCVLVLSCFSLSSLSLLWLYLLCV